MGSETTNSGFIKSAEKLEHFPDGSKAEIAILGRSNAGKSTLINKLLKKDLAFVSKTPGKTRLLNFYDFGPRGRIVDFPGYGYAQISKEDTKGWTEMVEGYLSSRPNLVGALLLVDIKRPLTDDEMNLINFLRAHNVPYFLIATKSDKLTKTEIQRQMKEWNVSDVITVSSQQNNGIEELRKLIIKTWIESWPKSLQ